MSFEVELRSVDGSTTALATAGQHSVVVDRPINAGGGGHGFNGGQLLHVAVAGCISNDLFREAALREHRADQSGRHGRRRLRRRSRCVDRDLICGRGRGARNREAAPRALVDHVDAIAEIPNSLRRGTEVRLTDAQVNGSA